MKLDQDCVRSLLLELEDNLTLNGVMTLYQLKDFEAFNKYGYETCAYALIRLIEAEFLNGSVSRGSNKIADIRIGSITWDGHHFLDNIRDDKVWKTVKKTTSKLSSVSLPLMSKLAWVATKKYLELE